MADFLARKAERESQSGITPAAAEYLARGLPAGDVASLKAAIAEEKKRMKETKGKGEEEENAKESEGLPEFNTRTAERERASAGAPAAPGGDGGGGGAGLGLDGGIFPSDVSPSKVDADITMRPAKLDPGQPEAMVGFWQVRRMMKKKGNKTRCILFTPSKLYKNMESIPGDRRFETEEEVAPPSRRCSLSVHAIQDGSTSLTAYVIGGA